MYKLFVIFSLLFCFAHGEAAAVRISGIGEFRLVRENGSFETLETWKLTIFSDGSKYKIMGECVAGQARLQEDAGSDGVDTFIVDDGRNTILTHGESGISGFIYSDRFPVNCSIVIQAAWIGYCSRDYFQSSSNQAGLCLSTGLGWTPPEYVTNIVHCWPDTTLPQSIVGWSRNIVTLPGRVEPVELKQYPTGFKAWLFAGTNTISIKKLTYPRQLFLEEYAPKPPKEATFGEDTTLTSSVTFSAISVQEEPNGFDPLPVSPVSNMTTIDYRFIGQTKQRFLIAHVSTNGWPTRSSLAFDKLKKTAAMLARANAQDEAKPKRKTGFFVIFFGVNVVIIMSLITLLWKKTNK